MSEAKTGFKARVESELAAAQGENLDELKACFQQEERAIEHQIDHQASLDIQPVASTHRSLATCHTRAHTLKTQVHTFSASVDVSYNFLSH